MNVHRHMARVILAFASIALMMGVDTYAQTEEGKSPPRGETHHGLAKVFLHGHRGDEGSHGHRGNRGKRGFPGPRGPIGPTGTTGPAGHTPFVIGSAYGDRQNDPPIAFIAIDNTLPNPTLQLAPLFNGTPLLPATNDPFYFTPYVPGTGSNPPLTATGASYTITEAGTYLFQYGLEGVPSSDLVSSFLITEATPVRNSACWICIQINRGGALLQIGAVPLTLTWTESNMQPTQTYQSQWIVAGFGQVWTPLEVGDIVTLQIMLTSDVNPYTPESTVPNPILYVGPTNLMYPSPSVMNGIVTPGTPVARGPTLTIMKIADP